MHELSRFLFFRQYLTMQQILLIRTQIYPSMVTRIKHKDSFVCFYFNFHFIGLQLENISALDKPGNFKIEPIYDSTYNRTLLNITRNRPAGKNVCKWCLILHKYPKIRVVHMKVHLEYAFSSFSVQNYLYSLIYLFRSGR